MRPALAVFLVALSLACNKHPPATVTSIDKVVRDVKLRSKGELNSTDISGGIGLSGWATSARVVQILDDTNAIAHIDGAIVWIRGFHTKGYVDGSFIPMGWIEITGTMRYERALAGPSTIWLVEAETLAAKSARLELEAEEQRQARLKEEQKAKDLAAAEQRQQEDAKRQRELEAKRKLDAQKKWERDMAEQTARMVEQEKNRAKVAAESEAKRKRDEQAWRDEQIAAAKKRREQEKAAADKKVADKEAAAQSRLKAAKRAMDDGSYTSGRNRMLMLIRDMPDTQAAKEAKKLLGID